MKSLIIVIHDISMKLKPNLAASDFYYNIHEREANLKRVYFRNNEKQRKVNHNVQYAMRVK